MLEKEYDYFLNNKETLFANYFNRVIVIKDEEVIGDYDTKEEALRETVKEHELGTFLIQGGTGDRQEDKYDRMNIWFKHDTIAAPIISPPGRGVI